MRDLIKERFPEHGVFGEELGMQQPSGNSKQHLWVLDPIDGTKSFITGMSTIPCIHSQSCHAGWQHGICRSVMMLLSIHTCSRLMAEPETLLLMYSAST